MSQQRNLMSFITAPKSFSDLRLFHLQNNCCTAQAASGGTRCFETGVNEAILPVPNYTLNPQSEYDNVSRQAIGKLDGGGETPAGLG